MNLTSSIVFSNSNILGIDDSRYHDVGRLENGIYSIVLTAVATQVEEPFSLPIRLKV